MLNTSPESAPDVVGWNIVAAFDDSLADTTNRLAHIGNPNEMQLDPIATLLRLFEDSHVRFSAQCRFKRECFLSI